MQINNHLAVFKQISSFLEQRKSRASQVSLTSHFYEELKQTIELTLAPERAAETKNITILLSDLRGFTAMSEKYSPLVVIELLNRYFSRMSEIIDEHNGSIDKFMGDSIMVLFGANGASEHDLKNAITCAIQMQIAMAEINEISQSLGMASLYMGIGINSGEVVAGTLGSEIYSEYTVIGDEVNLASRVEAHSLRGQILLTQNSYDLAKTYIEFGDRNEVMVKGKSAPITMYELTAITQPERLDVPCREVRKSPRVAVDMAICFKCLQGKNILNHEYRGQVIDISYGGLFILTKHYLTPFSEITMELSIPSMEDSQHIIYAQVISSSKVGQEYETHLEFTALEDSMRHAIKYYVDQIIQ